jgi:hypothetical protein
VSTDATCTCSHGCTCGCRTGTSVQTPQRISNAAGQPTILYRTGTWAEFRESMLARLSSAEYPALAKLKTRDSDDFTIAFLDATSVVLDILSFYQERLANESYLRTAQQLNSLTGLARLIGYQPAPGIAASVYLAFNLKSTPGATPDPSTPPITIPCGTQVQSVPGQGQTPQTFETSTPVPAKADWNALPVLAALPWVPAVGDVGLYLAGTATQLNPGDLILLVGDERTGNPASQAWSAHFLTQVKPDTANNRTWIGWPSPLTNGATLPVQHPKLYAFRQRASLFGYNAVDPSFLDLTNLPNIAGLLNSSQTEWDGLNPGSDIDLDSAYSRIVSASWVALTERRLLFDRGSAAGGGLVASGGFVLESLTTSLSAGGGSEIAASSEFVSVDPTFKIQFSQVTNLFRASSVTAVNRSDFGLSAKITRVGPDTTSGLSNFSPRDTAVFAQSEQLMPGLQPLDYPLYGTLLDLQALRPDLTGATIAAVTGNAQKIALSPGVGQIEFVPDDGSSHVPANPGDTFTLIEPPPLPFNADGSIPSWTTSASALTLKVEDASGRTGTLQGVSGSLSLSDFSLVDPTSKDPEISECALVSQVVGVTAPNSSVLHTQIQLKNALRNCYSRVTATVNANVVLATAGATVREIMGNGSAATPNQAFTLRQKPLTYVQAVTPNGRQSTLQVRANGVAWKEVATLFKQPATAQVFTIQNESDGTSDVSFGDGVDGSTLPTGQNNIIATYRIGSGAGGNVAPGAITTLMQRPLGVSGVTNPGSATGGADPESINDVRGNAPQTVLTLGRAVSIADYQNFAATFAGIAKAYALWIPSGPARGVFLSVAADGGSALTPDNPTLAKLVAALQSYGNPLISITAQSFIETLFGLSAAVLYDQAYDQSAVEAAIRQTIVKDYSFALRTFGQGISVDEIASTIQGVPGVIAVNVTNLSVIASSKGGDLANLSGGFTVSNWNDWMSQQVTVPRPWSDTSTRICSYLPLASIQALPLPAEILVLDPDPKSIVLGVMS